jgi:hypothetical protein
MSLEKRRVSASFSVILDFLIFLILAIGMSLLWRTQDNHDSSWLLNATANWLHGARLYVDILELNPPFIFFLHAPAVGIANLLGISHTQGFFVYVLGLVFTSAVWCRRLVARPDNRFGSGLFAVGATTALIFPFLADFGQREHLMVIFSLPYLMGFLTQPEPDRGWRALARAAFAAFGFLIKPYFLAIPVLLTLGRMVQARRLGPIIAPTNLVLLGAGIGYLVASYLLYPEYFTFILPVARDVYGAYRLSAEAILAGAQIWVLIPALLVIGFLGIRNLPTKGLYAALAVAGAGASYILQFNGFGYHAQPIFAFLLVGYAWLCTTTSARRTLVAACGGYLVTAAATFHLAPYRVQADSVFAPYLTADGRPGTFLAVSANIIPFFPLVDVFGAHWVGRFPVQWFIPGAVAGLAATDCSAEPQACARFHDIINQATRLTAEDIARNRPDVVIFDNEAEFFAGQHYDIQTLFLADPAFAAAMADYKRTASGLRYALWQRQSP